MRNAAGLPDMQTLNCSGNAVKNVWTVRFVLCGGFALSGGESPNFEPK